MTTPPQTPDVGDTSRDSPGRSGGKKRVTDSSDHPAYRLVELVLTDTGNALRFVALVTPPIAGLVALVTLSNWGTIELGSWLIPGRAALLFSNATWIAFLAARRLRGRQGVQATANQTPSSAEASTDPNHGPDTDSPDTDSTDRRPPGDAEAARDPDDQGE
jgi:hypothetical protein